MGGKKKGLSLEEKRQKLLEVYYDKVSLKNLLIMGLILSIERGAQLEGVGKVGTQEGHRAIDSQGCESVAH